MTTKPISDLDQRKLDEHGHEEAVRGMFDRIAPTYDRANRLMSMGIDTIWRKRAIAQLVDLPEGALLDSCAGTMDLTALLAKNFPDRKLVAMDFAGEMLEHGKQKAPAAERVLGDATKMPFGDSEFAGSICGFGMRNLKDTERGTRDMFRVLKPGGVFVTLEFFRPASASSRIFHAAYARAVLPTAGGLVSGEKSAYAYLAASMKGFLLRTEYEALLEKSGFENVHGFDLLFGIASIVVGTKAS
jgi:ubiquinone/menaquinone biosynthesis methyltransferase